MGILLCPEWDTSNRVVKTVRPVREIRCISTGSCTLSTVNSTRKDELNGLPKGIEIQQGSEEGESHHYIANKWLLSEELRNVLKHLISSDRK